MSRCEEAPLLIDFYSSGELDAVMTTRSSIIDDMLSLAYRILCDRKPPQKRSFQRPGASGLIFLYPRSLWYSVDNGEL